MPRSESLDGATARGLVVSLFSSQTSVIELLPEGSEEPLQVTPGHMIFSLDRETWIPAGKLRRGEELATLNGQVRLLEIRGGGEPLVVRNLEILGSHRYHQNWRHGCVQIAQQATSGSVPVE